MFPITQEAEIWNISSLDMYPAPHKISERALTILFMSKKTEFFKPHFVGETQNFMSQKCAFSCRKINVLRSQTLNKSSHVPQNLYWRFVSHQSIYNLPTGVLEAQRAREVVCLGLELHGSARHECGARRVGLRGPLFPVGW